MHNIQCELGREPGGQTSLPDNNLVLVSVNDINSVMTILISRTASMTGELQSQVPVT